MMKNRFVGPVLLITLGLLLFVNNLVFQLPLGQLASEFWPIWLIVPGIIQIGLGLSAGLARGWGALTGGVITTVIGCLFVLQNTGAVGFDRSWPVILIVVGLMEAMRFVAGVPSRRGVR